MRSVWLAMIVLAACGETKPDKFDESLAALEAIATKMCACTDAPCASAVQTDLRELRNTFGPKHGTDKASAAQEKKGRAFEERIRACRAKATGAATNYDEVLTRLDGLRAEICACVDKACATKVEAAWKTYRATMKEQLVGPATPTAEQDARGTAIDTEMKACLAKFE